MLRALPWEEYGFIVKDYTKNENIMQSAVKATAGIAESGTAVIACSGTSPGGLNFLPYSHCIFLARNNICFYFEEFNNYMDKSAPLNQGAINFISGPSRTADIEQTLQIGAHGPAELIIMLYN